MNPGRGHSTRVRTHKEAHGNTYTGTRVHTRTHTQTQARTHRNAGIHTRGRGPVGAPGRAWHRARLRLWNGVRVWAPRPLEEPPGGQQHSRWGKGRRFGYDQSSSLPRDAAGSGATAPGPPCQPLTTSTPTLAQHRHSPATRGPEAGGLVSGRLLPQPAGGTGEPRAGRGRFCPGQHLCQGPVCSGQQWGWDHEEGLQNAHPAWLGWHGGHVTPTFNLGTQAARLQTLSATLSAGSCFQAQDPRAFGKPMEPGVGAGQQGQHSLKSLGRHVPPRPGEVTLVGYRGALGQGPTGGKPGTADMQG